MTLLKIEPGVFLRKDENQENQTNPTPQKVTLTRASFLCSREISVGQFQRFISHANYPNEEKPEQWPDAHAGISPTPDHPVQQVNWYDAVLLCNWLSCKEGLTSCYERIRMKVKGRTLQKPGAEVEVDDWRLVPDGIGYRLPTEAEWEYTCRARTTTGFASGTDAELLRKHAGYATGNTQGAVDGASRFAYLSFGSRMKKPEIVPRRA